MAERRISIRTRQLAQELRRLREQHRRTGEEIAAALAWSSAKVSRIENAKVPIKVTDLRKLLSLYDVTEGQLERLLTLARTADERGWWDSYPNVNREMTMYVELEADATTVHSFSALVLHGLIQTEEYARRVISAGIVLPPGEIERRVQIRMRRQDRLTESESSLELRVVIDEAAIRRQIGSPEVMQAQLNHVLTLTEKPNIEIQILPFSEGAHPATFGPFVILEFLYPGSYVTYIELMDSGVYIEDEVQVHRHVLAFDELRGRALTQEDSAVFIRRVIAEV